MSKKDEALLPKGVLESMFPNMDNLTEKQKTSLRKTEYYHRRMSPDPLTLEELRKISNAKIFELTRVSESTINRWKAGERTVIQSALRR